MVLPAPEPWAGLGALRLGHTIWSCWGNGLRKCFSRCALFLTCPGRHAFQSMLAVPSTIWAPSPLASSVESQALSRSGCTEPQMLAKDLDLTLC